jgi:MipA family protein
MNWCTDVATTHNPVATRQGLGLNAQIICTMKIALCHRFGLALSLLLGPGVAGADQPLWELGLGAAALRLPHYRGSDQHHKWLLPLPYFIYRGEFFQSDREGTRAVLLKQPGLDLDLSANATAPVKSADNRARSGMPDLPATLELGPKLNLVLGRGSDWKMDLRLPVRAVFSLDRHFNGLGFDASATLNLDWRLNGWNLGLQGGPSWGDRKRNQFFYGVDAAAASPGRPAHSAKAGYAGWKSTVALSRRQDQVWTGLYLTSDTLAGASTADSPLVKSRQNWSAGVALVWVFATASERVPDKP